MPAHRKPASLLTPKYRRASGRDRESDPKPAVGIGPRVERLSKLEAACWDRVVELCPPGVLANSDEILVEMTARLWAKLKRGRATAADLTNLRACAGQLGMTPGARLLITSATEAEAQEYRDV